MKPDVHYVCRNGSVNMAVSRKATVDLSDDADSLVVLGTSL